MYALVYTVAPDKFRLIDHYIICETRERAEREYAQLLEQRDDIYCAGIAKIVAGTEPHWLDEESEECGACGAAFADEDQLRCPACAADRDQEGKE